MSIAPRADLGVEEQVPEEEGTQEAGGPGQQYPGLVPPVSVLHGAPEGPQLDVHTERVI